VEEFRTKGEERFKRLGIVTIIVVYLLILVGGIVRSTGSGMGCPDWPKCFGSWVPPTHISELPDNYQEIYSEKRAAKNEKFTAYLDFFGFTRLADEIRHDESILVEGEFNSKKTWTEYFNRLLGATTGMLIIATFIASLVYKKKDKSIPWLAFWSVVLVIFQGWIGSIVVSTNLLPWMITFHMLLALLLVALLIYLVFKASFVKKTFNPANIGLLRLILILCLGTLLLQTIVGTQVREAIDEIAIAFDFANRDNWIDELSFGFYFHRSFSILIVALHIWLAYALSKSGIQDKLVRNLMNGLIAVLVLVIVFGIIMAYFAIPPFAQPLHLLLSSLMFGIQFLLLLMLNNNRNRKEVKNMGEKEIVAV
jgi:cytochrome c oxidase assembly protein subunit 15